MSFKKLGLVCALLSISTASLAESIVALVNGEPILQSEVTKNLGKLANNKSNRDKTLQKLIDEHLLLQIIKRSNITVSPEEVEQKMEEIAYSQGLTYGQLLDSLDDQKIPEDHFKAQIANQLILDKAKFLIINNQISVDPKALESEKTALIEQDKKNKKFKPQEQLQYKIQHILLKITPLVDSKTVQTELQKIKDQINQGKISFADAAKKYSQDYVSAIDGGDLGLQTLQHFDPAFAKVAKNIALNTISQPFQTRFGWHILKVSEHKMVDVTDEYYQQKAYQKLAVAQFEKLEPKFAIFLRKNAQIEIF